MVQNRPCPHMVSSLTISRPLISGLCGLLPLVQVVVAMPSRKRSQGSREEDLEH